MTRRLFIAIDLPTAVQRRLAGWIADAPDGVRTTRLAQIHLTLHFLGDVEDGPRTRLKEALREVRSAPFALDIAGIGRFPPRGPARVLWAGVADNQALMTLHGRIGDVLRREGFAVEQRPYTPHVTLARLTPRAPRSWLNRMVETVPEAAACGIPVDAFALYASERDDDGAMHTVEATYALTPPETRAT